MVETTKAVTRAVPTPWPRKLKYVGENPYRLTEAMQIDEADDNYFK